VPGERTFYGFTEHRTFYVPEDKLEEFGAYIMKQHGSFVAVPHVMPSDIETLQNSFDKFVNIVTSPVPA
jgi:hypothetical protein